MRLLLLQRPQIGGRVIGGQLDQAGGVVLQAPVGRRGPRAEVAAPGVGGAEHRAVVREPADRFGRGELSRLLAAQHLGRARLVLPCAGLGAVVVVEAAVAGVDLDAGDGGQGLQRGDDLG